MTSFINCEITIISLVDNAATSIINFTTLLCSTQSLVHSNISSFIKLILPALNAV